MELYHRCRHLAEVTLPEDPAERDWKMKQVEHTYCTECCILYGDLSSTDVLEHGENPGILSGPEEERSTAYGLRQAVLSTAVNCNFQDGVHIGFVSARLPQAGSWAEESRLQGEISRARKRIAWRRAAVRSAISHSDASWWVRSGQDVLKDVTCCD